MIGRGSALCDVILLISLALLSAVFLTRYVDVKRRNSVDSPAAAVTSDEESPEEFRPLTLSAGSDAELSEQKIDDLLARVPDTRPAACHGRRYRKLPVATVVVVFSDYEFYDAKLTLTSMLRDDRLPQLVNEILLVDDASNRQQVLQDAQNYIQSVSRSFPTVRLVRLRTRVGRVRARSLAVDEHVTNDVVVCVDVGVVCTRGWLSPLLDLVSTASDGESTIAVPHYDQLAHPVALEYLETQSNLIATMSWSLTIRMRHRDTSTDSEDDGRLWRPAPVVRGDVFAVRRTFLSSIGGLYDSRLEDGTGAGEHVELSLRSWLCGGNIKVCIRAVDGAIYPAFILGIYRGNSPPQSLKFPPPKIS